MFNFVLFTLVGCLVIFFTHAAADRFLFRAACWATILFVGASLLIGTVNVLQGGTFFQ